jgi:hypothetical protein
MYVSSISTSLSYAIGLIRSADARVNAALPGLAMGSGSGSPDLAQQLRMAKVERDIAIKLVQFSEENESHLINMLT